VNQNNKNQILKMLIQRLEDQQKPIKRSNLKIII